MYSDLTGFAGSSLHARIFGTGSDIFDRTGGKLAVGYAKGATGTQIRTIFDGSDL